jgi:hypothetical protein
LKNKIKEGTKFHIIKVNGILALKKHVDAEQGLLTKKLDEEMNS